MFEKQRNPNLSESCVEEIEKRTVGNEDKEDID